MITDVEYTQQMLKAIWEMQLVLIIMKEHHAQQQEPQQLYHVYFTSIIVFLLCLVIHNDRVILSISTILANTINKM